MEDTSDIGCEGKLCAIASDTSVVVVSIFRAMVTYTLRGLELCISTLPALHVLTFRTSDSFQPVGQAIGSYL